MKILGKYADALKKLIENPNDLSTVPDLVNQISQFETEFDQLSKDLGESKSLAHKYLKMIPIVDQTEPAKAKEPEVPSFEQIVQDILKEGVK